MPLHPNLFRNGRDPKEEAQRLAELYTGYIPRVKGKKQFNNSLPSLVNTRESLLKSLKSTSENKKLPKEDRDFWKDVIVELNKIPETKNDSPKYFDVELDFKKLPRHKEPPKEKKLNPLRFLILPLVIAIIVFIPRVIDGLTSVDTLTERIHEKSKYGFNGSVCNDGTLSHSQGQGTCSWHGGVDHTFTADEYQKSLDECRREATRLSWRN